MEKRAYRFGAALARHRWMLLGGLVCVAALFSHYPAEQHPLAAATGTQGSTQHAMRAPTAECLANRDGLMRAYVELTGAGDYSGAAYAIGECARLLNDSELLALRNEAAVKFHMAAIRKQALSTGARADAIEAFAADYPNEAADLVKELPALRSRQHELDQASESARRRGEGVQIGMSAEDVRASSWGKPGKVNRTTTVHGTSEQWVYPGGYLYFQNGRLTAIQN